MIISVAANQESFREVTFEPGFNVVLADRTQESTKKDSRNGLGKSTLLEIIHFCLGSSGAPLKAPELKEWSFTTTIRLRGQDIRVTRSVAKPKFVIVEGDTEGWPIQPESFSGKPGFSTSTWTTLLGSLMFGLPARTDRETFTPSFRSLVAYFARRSKDAFSTPFEHFRKQQAWDKQVNVAYLLSLAWEDARDLKVLKEREKLLGALKAAEKSGVVAGAMGTLGELEATRVQLQGALARQRESLRDFSVLPEYRSIEAEANEITRELHKLANHNIADGRLVGMYEQNLSQESAPEVDEVLSLYEQADVQLPGAVVKRLEEVRSFHESIVENRRSFLDEEVKRLRASVADRETRISDLSRRRAELLDTLRGNGALDEFQKLERRALKLEGELGDVERRIADLKKFEQGKSAIKVEREQLKQRARRDYEERDVQRRQAIELFNENSEALYSAPGKLLIDIDERGFQFGVEIERSGSLGIQSMKVFCFDLMLAQLWASRDPAPEFLAHDSALYDGVDERQVALALQLAASKSEELGFQYISTLNSDAVPTAEFEDGFSLEPFVRLRLTDADESGCLLGVRF